MTEKDAEEVCARHGLTVCRTWRSSISGALYVWVMKTDVRDRVVFLRAERVQELEDGIVEWLVTDTRNRLIDKPKNGKGARI